MSLTLNSKHPLHTFVKVGDGYAFLNKPLLSSIVKPVLNTDYKLGLLNVFDLTYDGKVFGFYFVSGGLIKYNVNYISTFVGRTDSDRMKVVKNSKFELLYRPENLRIFSVDRDFVMVVADIGDRIRQKLETQD